LQTPESNTPVDPNALTVLREMVGGGTYWRKKGMDDIWLLDVFCFPRIAKPKFSNHWRPEHFLALLDDYERLLKEEAGRVGSGMDRAG